MNCRNILAALICAAIITPTAYADNILPPENMSGGYAWKWRSKSLPASNQPRPLPKIAEADLTADQRTIVEMAKQIPKNQHNLAIILVDKGRILYENYKHPSNPSAPMMSWSMSKSLTAYTIGNLHCDGGIGPLTAPARDYSRTLENMGVYGQASVIDLMKMASGAEKPNNHNNGERYEGAWEDIVYRQSPSLEKYMKDYSRVDERTRPGTQFWYSNTDTTALGYIAEDNGGFVSNFDKYIWSKIGAEHKSYWLIDRNNKAVTYGGFNASARDYARLAMFTIDQLKRGDSCIKDFMRAAISPQIRTNFLAFTQYGYHTLVEHHNNQKSYWWRGHAGQFVAVDPEKERILYVGSYSDTYFFEISYLFREWQKQR
jgi:CubicO group peptidase (beta-lactamase class C family)